MTSLPTHFITYLFTRLPGDEYFEWLNKLSPEERAAVEAQNKVSRKDRTCNRPECKNVFNSLSLQAIEKANAEKRIEELNSLINTVGIHPFSHLLTYLFTYSLIFTLSEENYSEVSEILNNLQNEGNDLMTRMEALRYKERKGFKDRQHAIMQQKTMFEQKIKATGTHSVTYSLTYLLTYSLTYLLTYRKRNRCNIRNQT